MKNYVLSNTKDSKKEYKKVINQTCSAILKSINSEKSYAGPTPQELKEIVPSVGTYVKTPTCDYCKVIGVDSQ